jgi:hypothetical protein
MKLYWITWTLNMAGVLMKGGNLDTVTHRTQREDEARHWKCHGSPANHQEQA